MHDISNYKIELFDIIQNIDKQLCMICNIDQKYIFKLCDKHYICFDCFVEFYNLLGIKLETKYPDSEKKIQICSNEFPAGIYFYRLTNDKGTILTGKFEIIKY